MAIWDADIPSRLTAKRLFGVPFISFVVGVYDFIQRLIDIVLVDLLGKHKDHTLTKGEAPQAVTRKRIAIVAIYPTKFSLPFTRNLIRGLMENDFFVFVVASTRLKDALRAQLLPECHLLAERFPVGRDFGSYQLGLNWIEANRASFPNLDTIAIANDSMFYTKHFGGIVKKLLNFKDDWLAIYESWSPRYHAQSYFEVFRKPVFESPAFSKYWRKYKPYSSRPHVISQGEVKLSAYLIDKGKLDPPRVLYASPSILAEISKDLHADNASALSKLVAEGRYYGAMSPSQILRAAHRLGNAAKNGQSVDMETLYDKAIARDTANRIVGHIENHNPTHVVAFLANNLFNAPLKRDLCYRGSYSMGFLVNQANGFDTDELYAMEQDIRKRGLPASIRGLRRILWSRGRV